MAVDYHNLDMQVELSNGLYRVRLQCPPYLDTGEGVVNLPFTPQDLKRFFAALGQTRGSIVDTTTATPTLSPEEFGRQLYRAVFSGRLESFLLRCQDGVAADGKRLRIRLRLKAPELLNLPWEYLYNADRRRYLALDNSTSIVRYLELDERIPSLRTTAPLRVLVMSASPKDAVALNAARERDNLKQALQPLADANQVVVDWLPKATLGALRQKLASQTYHVFHFIGHGDFDTAGQDGLLLLEDDDGAKRPVAAQVVGQYLRNSPSLRLVVLNACEGARTGDSDPFAGTAQTLMLQNIAAVVAMQFSITDRAAIAFGGEFYTGLTKGQSLDEAMTNGRFAIQEQTNDREWGTPVLYMRAADGYIFDVPQAKAPDKPDEPEALPPSIIEKYLTLAPHVRLRELLNDFYSLPDLEVLCSTLNITWEDLRGDTKPIKVLSLIEYCKHRLMLGKLIQAAHDFDARRALLPWPNAADIK